MTSFLDFLKLIRAKNLLIVALSQYLIKYTLILPFSTAALNEFDFFLLVLSTVLIAAAGYIINDYFDTHVDQLNHRKVIVGNTIKRRVAMILHFAFSGIGVVIGFYLAWKIGHIKLGVINLFSSSALWFYSTHFKRQYLSGNLMISLLSALVLIIVGVYELIPQPDANSSIIFYIICFYAVFAFITTFIREVVKDMEDLEGDQKMGYNTFAIREGITKSKNVVSSISVLTILGIAYILYSQFQSDWKAFLYVCLAIELPFVYFTFLLQKAKNQADFHQLSNWIKVIMLTGTLSMLIFYLFI
jgi:4-hydroxybenzoate polyprenyltransferase